MALLDGYRVLDVTDERGLVAGRMPRRPGADVVPARAARRLVGTPVPPLVAGSGSAYWEAFAAGRRGVAVDLESAEGRAAAADLAARSDFVLTSAPPAELRRWGLDAATLLARDPGLVHVHVSAFGADGPKAHYRDSDLVVCAAGGPLDPHRDEDRPPVRISSAQASCTPGPTPRAARCWRTCTVAHGPGPGGAGVGAGLAGPGHDRGGDRARRGRRLGLHVAVHLQAPPRPERQRLGHVLAAQEVGLP